MTGNRTILVTGGAGFVGSSLSLLLKRDHADTRVVALDNLRRSGSELALARLRAGGVEFVHGDVRSREDLAAVGKFDVLIECAAEPSVHAGYNSGPDYVIDSNLTGAINCFEAARRNRAAVIFLSTSRVYPIASLRDLPFETACSRLVLPEGAKGLGWSQHGIETDFPLTGSRSLYGSTKLSAELLLEEFHAMYGIPAIVNRCGVIAGPWQMGKVDQGFAALWAARHVFGGPLTYMGFGGTGVQVRDLLHVADLYELIAIELRNIEKLGWGLFNAGGGPEISASLAEVTKLCQELSGSKLTIGSDPATRAADIPWYVTDNRRVTDAIDWRPVRNLAVIFEDIVKWLADNRTVLEPIFRA